MSRIPSLSRRGFLGGLVLGGAALSLTPVLSFSAAAARRPSPAEEEAEALRRYASIGIPQLDPALVARLFRRAADKGCEFCELYVETRRTVELTLEEREIISARDAMRGGVGIRVWSGATQGFAASEVFTESALTEALDLAATLAKAGPGSNEPRPVGSYKLSVPRFMPMQRPLMATPPAEIAKLLSIAANKARRESTLVTSVTVKHTHEELATHLYNSLGLDHSDLLPMLRFDVSVVVSKDGKRGRGRGRTSARRGFELLVEETPEMLASRAVKQALTNLEARPAPKGTMPVVLGNMGGVLFHEAVGHGLEADAVTQGNSVFAGKRGERVASSLVTLRDDPTRPGLRGSYHLDDEGTPARSKTLIRDGILVDYLYDRRSAAKEGRESNGNGRRESFAHLPQPRMSNTYIANGTTPAKEVIAATEKGIYAVDFGGGEVNPITGQFTFNLTEGYLIEQGKVTAPIRGAALVGSCIEVLEQIDMVGDDLAFWVGTCGKDGQWVPVTTGCPTLRIKSITVGGEEA